MIRRGHGWKILVVPQLDVPQLVVPQLDVPELVILLLSLGIFVVFVCDFFGFLRLLKMIRSQTRAE